MSDCRAEQDAARLLDAVRDDDVVLAVILFGSQARREGTPLSDLDICLVLNPNRYSELELSEKRLHYLKSFDFDIQIFQQLPVFIRTRVLRDGRVLFCRDEQELYDVAFRTSQRFEDYRHIYNGYLEEVASGHTG